MIDHSHHIDTLNKVVRDHARLRVVLTEKHPNAKIVLVKGVYDLIHSGHYYSFINAKALGDVLVVAVNSDVAVRKRKGETRPIIREENRVLLVAALACVDWVTVYEEETPYQLIKTLNPHVFAASHFDSLSNEQRAEIENYTSLVRVPKMGSDSTTDIIARIRWSGKE